jgi:hypothetical protein
VRDVFQTKYLSTTQHLRQHRLRTAQHKGQRIGRHNRDTHTPRYPSEQHKRPSNITLQAPLDTTFKELQSGLDRSAKCAGFNLLPSDRCLHIPQLNLTQPSYTHPPQFKHALKAPNHHPLQVQLCCNPQCERPPQRIMICHKGPSISAASNRFQHWRLNLQAVAAQSVTCR